MFGKTSLLFLAAAAGLRVAQADFFVYTEPPIPTTAIPSFANPSEASSWTTFVFLNAQIAYGRFQSSLGPSYKSSQSSAASEIAAFASTASNYSIPAVVTESGTTTFFSRPDWYTALPSGARSFKEQQVSDQFSIVRSIVDASASRTASSTAGAAPTARAWVDAKFGAMAAVAAAAFL
ncbi:uncharacterized protein K460DRAFT_276771 [Cucurbitaria berberidis CBS 394.84]|uniref:Uncharacterized protein n=1 Tax=Cucurbitaria berberidis CBS 394.84 TaxID=1168544 RepID=A0A9P4GKX0_9PLEO|nr:uncharacterized protein K460DRAFT_276771 [Cucurbitaria berberidis CBS 394.84]KAF1846971.1 hypothetical protein K460DRAFT_276771 [Cucurbitaria berberidis CBS 394.84]